MANNKVQPQNKIAFLPVEEDLNWCLDKLVNGWMRIIGIEPNIPEKKGWHWIVWFLQRWTCFLLSLGVNVYILIFLHLKNKEEADKKISSTLSWNEWMDYSVTSFHSISIHLLLLLVVSPNWNELRMALNGVECNMMKFQWVYPRLRNIVPRVIAAFLFAVRYHIIYHFNRFFPEHDNCF